MARASTYTLLSLDRYARIIGLNPMHFNGGLPVAIDSSLRLYPLQNTENDIWPQYSWQNNDMMSREGLAMLIRDAEYEIIDQLGFFPAPDWIEEEVSEMPTYYRPNVSGVMTNVRTRNLHAQLQNGKFLSGGKRATTLLATATIVYTDADTDGWKELGVIEEDVGSAIDIKEIKFYFVGKDADRHWEIRPPKRMWYTTGTNTLNAQFDTFMLIDPDNFELPSSEDGAPPRSVNLSSVPANLVATIEVYREYNDTSENGVEFYESDGPAPTLLSGGYLNVVDKKMGIVNPVPASYSADTGIWTKTSCITTPDYMQFNYYSGYDEMRRKPIANDRLWTRVESAIAYLATARFDKVFYANNNATVRINELMKDWADSQDSRHFLSLEDIRNPFGTRAGEVKAWRIIRKHVMGRLRGVAL